MSRFRGCDAHIPGASTSRIEERTSEQLPDNLEDSSQLPELALDNVPANSSSGHVTKGESRKQSDIELSDSGIQLQMSRSTKREIPQPQDQPEIVSKLWTDVEVQDETHSAIEVESTPVDETAGPSLPMRSPFQNVPLNRPPRLIDLKKWDTLKLLEVGSHVTGKCDARSGKDVSRCEINVEEPPKV